MIRCTLIYPNSLLHHSLENLKIDNIPATNIKLIAQSTNSLEVEIPNEGSNDKNGAMYDQLLRFVKEITHISHPAFHFVDDEGDECCVTSDSQLLDAYHIWGQKLKLEVNIDDKFVLKSDIPSPTLNSMESPSLSFISSSLSSNMLDHAQYLKDADENDDEELYSEARALSEPVLERNPTIIHNLRDMNDNHENVVENNNNVHPRKESDSEGDHAVEMDEDLLNEISSNGLLNTMTSFIHLEHESPNEAQIKQQNSNAFHQDFEPGNKTDASSQAHSLNDDDCKDELKEDSVASSLTHLNSISLASYLSSYFNNPDILRAIDEHPEILRESIASDESFYVMIQRLNQLSPTSSAHPCTQIINAIRGLHMGTTCVHCFRSPIQGVRYHCVDCTSSLDSMNEPIDICENCVATHSNTHNLERLDVPYIDIPTEAADAADPTPTKKDKFSERFVITGRKILDDLKELRLKLSEKMDPIVQDIVDDMRSAMNELARSVDSFFTKKSKKISPSVSSPQTELEIPSATIPNLESNMGTSRISNQAIEVIPPEVIASSASSNHDEDEDHRLSPRSYLYATELETIRSMGFIIAAADELTVIEFLNASKGNVDQTIQWLVDCAGYGK